MPARKVVQKNTENVTLPVPAANPELSKSAQRMLSQAKALVVASAADYESAAVVLQNLTTREKEIAAMKAEMWNPLAKLTKSVQSLFNPPLKILDDAKKAVSAKMGAYALEQRNIALAAQRRAEDEAEEARQKLLDKAEAAADDGNHARAEV